MENVNTLTLKDRSTRRHASWSCEDKTHTPLNKMLFHCVLSRFYFANVTLHWSENKMPSQAFSVITMDLGFEKHSHQRERYGISKVTKKQCGSSLNLNNCNCLFKQWWVKRQMTHIILGPKKRQSKTFVNLSGIFRAVSNKELLFLCYFGHPIFQSCRFIPSEFTLAPMKYELKEGAEETKRKVNSTRLNEPISDELRQC